MELELFNCPVMSESDQSDLHLAYTFRLLIKFELFPLSDRFSIFMK